MSIEMYDWTNKVAAITGASSGIGAVTAKMMAERGATVLLMARSEDKLAELSRQLPGTSDAFILDVGSAESVERVFREALARHGRIDVLVNNAGFGMFKWVQDTELADFERMMNVNYMGVVRCTKAVLPSMLSAGSGHIVNVASLAGKIATAKSAGYSASKHAVIGFTNSLRQELAGKGIRVTAINPGPVDTPFFDIADPSGGYVSRIRALMLKPEQVARSIVRAVEAGRPEADLPKIASFGVKLFHLFPRTFARAGRRFLNFK
jgi:hypothetical protein